MRKHKEKAKIAVKTSEKQFFMFPEKLKSYKKQTEITGQNGLSCFELLLSIRFVFHIQKQTQ